jgi:hypothetical protein
MALTNKPSLSAFPMAACFIHSTTQACQLDLPQLPAQAWEAHILPGLTHSSLVSIGKLCNAGCEAHFTAIKVIINKDNRLLMTGPRDQQTGLWRIKLNNQPTPKPTKITKHKHCKGFINHAYQEQTIPELMQFLHATAFSPVPSITWINAIQQGFFQGWSGLTATAVRKHLPKSEATSKGHLVQTRKNVRSTKTTKNPCSDPVQEPHNKQMHQLFATIESSGKIYTDQNVSPSLPAEATSTFFSYTTTTPMQS